MCGLVLAVLVSGSVAGCGGALEPAGLTNATAGSLLVLLPDAAITKKTLLAVLDLRVLFALAAHVKIKLNHKYGKVL